MSGGPTISNRPIRELVVATHALGLVKWSQRRRSYTPVVFSGHTKLPTCKYVNFKANKTNYLNGNLSLITNPASKVAKTSRIPEFEHETLKMAKHGIL